MDPIETAATEIAAALAPILRRLFEAGELSGYDKARNAAQAAIADAFKRAIDGSSAITVGTGADISAVLPAFAPHDIKTRAAPGSVKPAILEIIKKQPGLTRERIQAMSGAKHNSVRGTLWALEKEGKIERKDGKYSVPDNSLFGDAAE